jgi:hypothetical protein
MIIDAAAVAVGEQAEDEALHGRNMRVRVMEGGDLGVGGAELPARSPWCT